MSEKPIAIVLAFVGVVSLCTVCALGPAAVGAAAGWGFGRVTDLGPMATIGVILFGTLAVYALFRRWGGVRPGEDSEPAALSDIDQASNR